MFKTSHTPSKKKICFKGQESFFLAYPSSPHWQDFYSKLVDELRCKNKENREFVVDSWEGAIKNDLLFSKVCEGIHSHNFLLAEVTEPNPNVLMEVGYALAVVRLPILLSDINREQWSRNLLTTLESCRYETREDIQLYINRFLGRNDIPNEPGERLPFLENMGIYEVGEIPDTVYHLKPKLSTDWISRVDRTLESSRFTLLEGNPSDATYDEFYSQASNIQEASLIVASLLGCDYVDWEQHNANVALLIGFAIGLGKRVLVLQYRPHMPILDLGSVLRPIATESQAERTIDSWINGHIGPIHVKTSSARVELGRWEWGSTPYRYQEFQMGTDKRNIGIFDEYVYCRHDKLLVAPKKGTDVKLYWKSSGRIGKVSGFKEDETELETSRYRDRVDLIYSLRGCVRSIN